MFIYKKKLKKHSESVNLFYLLNRLNDCWYFA